MKLQFKKQDFQTQAVNAVADLFIGQEHMKTSFSIIDDKGATIGINGIIQNEKGTGNKLTISQTDMLLNMNRVQIKNVLRKTKDLYPFSHIKEGDNQFTIEMETGTGKTYVYTKTIFELNKRYGFTKFIIVVPSVAIREGVYKSLSVTAEHFGTHYDNAPCRYFIYNSSKLSDIRQFATSTNIEIMIINIDAFKKAENIINQAQDRLNGEAAINYIKDTNPIVIIDEPQSVDNTQKSKEAIASLNPMCVIRYSATHKEKRNLLYKLTPVDAYQKGLVKKISVIEQKVDADNNKPYIMLKEVSRDPFSAKIEIDSQDRNLTVKRKTITVKQGDDLYKKSGNRELYQGYTIAGIDTTPEYESIEFSDTTKLYLGKSIGGVDELVIKREQIYRTIQQHLRKEKRYINKGIKVLSLFFIDEVAKYRGLDGEKGIYAKIFEEEYTKLINNSEFEELRTNKNFINEVTAIHDGYFSQDKVKKTWKDTKGDSQADYDTYNLIMKDKELLLSYKSPLRFIFSHSALKEGWDNPNVFQVCTLIEQKTIFTQRQKIGRGLRLCVNQKGERIEDREINRLHVIANESYSEFASKLQREIEEETGTKFGIVDIDMFVGQTYDIEIEETKTITKEEATEAITALKESGIIDNKGNITAYIDKQTLEKPKLAILPDYIKKVVSQATLVAKEKDKPLNIEIIETQTYKETKIVTKEITHKEATEIVNELKEKGLINKNGTISKQMKEQIEQDTLQIQAIPEPEAKHTIINSIKEANNYIQPANESEEVTVKLKEKVIKNSPQFLEIWHRIKQKTTYHVEFDINELIEKCQKDFENMELVGKTNIISTIANIDIQKYGIEADKTTMLTTMLDTSYSVLPDLLSIISEKALIKRTDVAQILYKSGRMKDFLNNPQAFTEKALEIITRNRHSLAIDAIKYTKLEEQEYDVWEVFENKELIKELDKNATKAQKSVYNYVVYDSGVENRFAQELEKDEEVKLFFKIPEKFKIQTPIGSYNPDWAVYLEKEGETKLYFVLETKGTGNINKLSPEEQMKIKCGEAHFKTLGTLDNKKYRPVKEWTEFKKTI